ncbi:hypothetical protein LC612_33450 [Nostoc sp. CHAB 5834]|nr:hypothetical protein [Nostoc sp. CHAB 5834]
MLIIKSLLNDQIRVSAFQNACITHVISLNPVFCVNTTHTPVLSHPAIRLALTAPQTRQQLEENLAVLHAPQIEAQEAAKWQEYGNLIYGTGQDGFDTQWI